MDSLKRKLIQFEWEERIGFYVDSRQLKECVKYINENNIQYLILNEVYGYKKKDCDFLIDTPGIGKLDIVNDDIDLQGINALKNLDDLYLNVSKRQKFSFSGAKKLKKLNFEYFDGLSDFETCISLKEITVRKGDKSLLDNKIFGNYKNLSFLKIVQSKMQESVDFLKDNHKLKTLEFHHCRSAINLDGLDHLKDSLQTLKIASCKNVLNLDVIAKMKELKQLTLSDSAPVSGIKVIKDLPKLKELMVFGSSFFEDGDLRNLKNQYSDFDVDEKKHYIFPEWYKKK